MSGLFGGVAGARELAALRAGLDPDAPTAPKRRSLWSASEDATLRDAYRPGGGGAGEAAMRLGRSPHGCLNRAKRLRLRDPRTHLVSLTALAAKAGVRRGRARNLLSVLGLPTVTRADGANPRARTVRHPQAWLHPNAAKVLLEALARAPRVIITTRPDRLVTRKGTWGSGRKPAACLFCGSTHRPHYAGGYCSVHYEMLRRLGWCPPPLAVDADPAPLAPTVPRDVLGKLIRVFRSAKRTLGLRDVADRVGLFAHEAREVVGALLTEGLLRRARDANGGLRAYELATRPTTTRPTTTRPTTTRPKARP